MIHSNSERALVLTQALPYFQKYFGKIVVVKYGGNAMINEDLRNAVMGDLVLLQLVGVKVVLVHGGGPEISDMLKKIGKQSEFVNGLRVTDEETSEIIQMVLAGKINKSLVNYIQNNGGKAIGLSGMDGHMIRAKQMDPALGYVGDVEKIDPQPILDVLQHGYIPVVSTIGCDNGEKAYNINADTAAAAIAAALEAECLISMTDIGGLMHDKDDPSTVIPVLKIDDAPKLMEEGVISGGMIPKVDCCINAIKDGVKKVFIIDGRIPHSLIVEMFTDEGIGTMFVK
ncbi:MAG: acetylglutamate kinase [Christensenellaceae bacterium]|nr:acetylglutamate kinase [Christensenellaceae bacterium]